MPQTLHFAFLAYAGILGASVGSFLNVCISRLPAGESIIRPRSRCPSCGATIAWYDNVPVASWILLRGRCRHCSQRISLQYPAVELATMVLWVGMGLLYGPTWKALQGSVLCSLLLAIAITDARHYLIPDALSLGGLGAGIALALLPGDPSLVEAVLGAGLGFGALLAVGLAGEWIFKKPAMGGGDIKMMAMVGAFLGPAGATLTIFLGALAGTLVFAPISIRTNREVPFGIFLSLGAAIAFLAGDAMVAWYGRVVLGAP